MLSFGEVRITDLFLVGRAWTRGEFDPLRGIDVDTVGVKNPVEVRSRGASRGTGVAERVAFFDERAIGDGELRHVQIH